MNKYIYIVVEETFYRGDVLTEILCAFNAETEAQQRINNLYLEGYKNTSYKLMEVPYEQYP